MIGTCKGNIMTMGTGWQELSWTVGSGMDVQVLVKEETWNFLMNGEMGDPWLDYCAQLNTHLCFMDVKNNGMRKENVRYAPKQKD